MRRVAVLALFVGLASPAASQMVWQGESTRDGVIKPKMSYPVGNPDAIGRIMWGNLRLAAARQKACMEIGCLIIINGSDSYRLDEFYVRPVSPRTPSDWGPNQFDRPLRAREAAVRFKLPDERFCSWPVRFVMRNRKTREVVPIETSASLCASPRKDTVLNVRVLHPDVKVEEPTAG